MTGQKDEYWMAVEIAKGYLERHARQGTPMQYRYTPEGEPIASVLFLRPPGAEAHAGFDSFRDAVRLIAEKGVMVGDKSLPFCANPDMVVLDAVFANAPQNLRNLLSFSGAKAHGTSRD